MKKGMKRNTYYTKLVIMFYIQCVIWYPKKPQPTEMNDCINFQFCDSVSNLLGLFILFKQTLFICVGSSIHICIPYESDVNHTFNAFTVLVVKLSIFCRLSLL